MGKITKDELSIRFRYGWWISLSIQSDLYFCEKQMRVESNRRAIGSYHNLSNLVIEFDPERNEGCPAALRRKARFSRASSGEWITSSYRAGTCRSFVFLSQKHETAGDAVKHRFGGGKKVVDAVNEAVTRFQSVLNSNLAAAEKRAIAKNNEMLKTPWGKVAEACGHRPLGVNPVRKREFEWIASYFEREMSAARSKNVDLLKEAEQLIRKKTARIAELEQAVMDLQKQVSGSTAGSEPEKVAPLGSGSH